MLSEIEHDLSITFCCVAITTWLLRKRQGHNKNATIHARLFVFYLDMIGTPTIIFDGVNIPPPPTHTHHPHSAPRKQPSEWNLIQSQ